MSGLVTAIAWIEAHPILTPILLALFTAVLRMIYGVVVILVKPYPRVRAMVEFIAAGSPDLLRMVVMGLRVVTGRDFSFPLADQRDAEIDRLRSRVAELAAREAERAPSPKESP